LIRWFSDLPIERKLRVVIMVPAMAAFGIALAMHVATNLLHLRADLLRRALAVDDLERWHTDWLHSTLGQAASVA
jgi:hypothetical protein